MPPENLENEVFLAQVSEVIAEAAVTKFAMLHPELAKVKAEIPAPIKWAGGIISALLTAGVAGTALWLVSSVSNMQVTLARMDERQQLQASTQGEWKTEVERRLTRLESLKDPRNAAPN